MIISSHNNTIAKQVRALRRVKERRASGLFIIEGIRPVGEVVEAQAAGVGYIQLDFICYSPNLLTSDYARWLVEQQASAGMPCYSFTAEVFASFAEKENPQGILAVGHRASLDLTSLSPANFPWGVALASPQDPGNLGAILRTIDAVGASGLLLLETSADPTHPSAVRASMGTLFWYPVVRASFNEFVAWTAQHGYTIYGTSAHASQEVEAIESYRRPLILLLGSERQGLSLEQAAVCHYMLRLPMKGRASSLNLAVAAGVLLYDILQKGRL